MSGPIRNRRCREAAVFEESHSYAESAPWQYSADTTEHPSARQSRRECCSVANHERLYKSNLHNMSETASHSPSPGNFEQFGNMLEERTPECKLPGCRKAAWRDRHRGQLFDFCGKTHMLTDLEVRTRGWNQLRKLCSLEDCFRHVWVDDAGRSHDFCGWSHAKLAAERRGSMWNFVATAAAPLNRGAFDYRSPAHQETDDFQEARNGHRSKQGETSTVESLIDSGRGYNETSTVESLIDSGRGYNEKINDLDLQRLLKGEPVEGCSTSVQHGIDIYDFHPWELLTKYGGKRARYFLNSTTKQQQEEKGGNLKRRQTKDGYSWKQSGRPHTNKIIKTRYMVYKSGGERRGLKCGWTMHELTLAGSNDVSEGRTIRRISQDIKPVAASARQTAASEGSVPSQSDVQRFISGVVEDAVQNVSEEYGFMESLLDNNSDFELDTSWEVENFASSENLDELGNMSATGNPECPNVRNAFYRP